MALFNFLGNSTPVSSDAENTTLNLGIEFEVFEPDCELAGFRVYNPVAGGPVKQGRCYEVAGQTVVAGPVNFPTDQGWVEVMLGVGFPLVVGTRYKLAQWLGTVMTTYGFTQNFWNTDIISGPAHAFSAPQATQGQGSFNSTGFPSYPATASGTRTNYFIDVIIFQPDPPSGGAVVLRPTQADMDRVVARVALPATWPDDITATEPAIGSGVIVRGPVAAGGSTAGGMVTQPQGNESLSGAGSSTVDHVAGTAVATTGAIATAGLYQVVVRIAHTAGTPVGIDDLNYALRVNTTAKATLLVPRALGVVAAYDEVYLRVTATQTINIAAIGAGTAGVRASASIICTKVAD